MKNNEKVKEATLSGLMKKLQDLPMLPSVVARLMALSPNDDEFFEKVLELANDDPPFSVRLIILANSASMAPASPITTLPHAIARIGAQSTVDLIFSMAVLRVFVPSTQGQRNLWVHAVQVAVTAKLIAEMSPALQVDPDQAYFCGLIHDIGRFILFDESVEELGRIDETNWSTPQQLIDAEMALCGFNHAELGWHACKKWKLPKIIALCIQHHHDYLLPCPEKKYEKVVNLVQIVQMADLFSVLIILEPEVLKLEADKLEQKISETCFPEQWKNSPCSAKQLQSKGIQIQNESEAILLKIGIRTGD